MRVVTVGLVWVLIFTLGILYVLVFLMPFLVHYTFLGVLLTLCFLPFYALLVASYFKVTTVGPGFTQPSFNLKYSENDLDSLVKRAEEIKSLKEAAARELIRNEIALLKEITYCFKCKTVKPLRCHHCSVCDRCVLRMDHHCPWVGSCIGLNNHKLFLLFTGYSTVSLSYVWITLMLSYFVKKVYPDLSPLSQQVYIYQGVACFLLSLVIGLLFANSLVQLSKNVTTLESFLQGITVSPFDRGNCRNNLEQVLGREDWLLPCLPSQSALQQQLG